MAERDVDEPTTTNWEQLGPKHYRATIEAASLGRRFVHEYLICEFVVVEIDKLFENDEPMAVFRTRMTADEIGKFDDEDELVEQLQTLAFDAPGFQIVEEFDASIETFESST